MLAYSLGEIWDDERLDEVMMEIDADGSGEIDFDEFAFWFQNSIENGEERDDNLSRGAGSLHLRAKLLRRYFAGTMVRKFKQVLRRMPAGFRYLNVFGGRMRSQPTEEILPPSMSEAKEDGERSDGERRGVTFDDEVEGEKGVEEIIPTTDESMSESESDSIGETKGDETTDGSEFGDEDDESGGLTINIKKKKKKKKKSKKKKKKKRKLKKNQTDWMSSRPMNYEVDEITTELILDRNTGGDIRLAYAWADAWFFNQLSPSMYTVSSDGYCIVHGEWEAVELKDYGAGNKVDPHTRDVEMDGGDGGGSGGGGGGGGATGAAISGTSSTGTSSSVMGETKEEEVTNMNGERRREIDSYLGTEQSQQMNADATLETMQEELRVMTVKSGTLADVARARTMRCLRRAACRASNVRSIHDDPDENSEDDKRKNKNKKKKIRKKRVPHGPGTALFPVPRIDWKQKGQSNAGDFGKLIVGDFKLWKTDILDITFSHHLFDQFKLTLAAEIANAVGIGANRVKIWDVEDINPYHDQKWTHRRCTMIYTVPIRFRSRLPRHLRAASRPKERCVVLLIFFLFFKKVFFIFFKKRLQFELKRSII